MLGSVSSAREAERFLTVQWSTELPPSGTIFAPFKTRWRDCSRLDFHAKPCASAGGRSNCRPAAAKAPCALAPGPKRDPPETGS